MKRIICLFAAVAVAAAAFDCPAGAVSAGDSLTEISAAAALKTPKGEIKTVVFETKLHCKNCVNKVKENISFEKGVKDLKVDLEAQTITIKYDSSKTSEEKLAAAIRKLGYPATVRR